VFIKNTAEWRLLISGLDENSLDQLLTFSPASLLFWLCQPIFVNFIFVIFIFLQETHIDKNPTDVAVSLNISLV